MLPGGNKQIYTNITKDQNFNEWNNLFCSSDIMWKFYYDSTIATLDGGVIDDITMKNADTTYAKHFEYGSQIKT